MTALVLLPGMDGTGDLFAELLSALGPTITPIVVHYPTDLPLDYQGLEDFARAYLPTHEPYVLLGESFSGPIAIALAAAQPAGLIGLVLSCTYARNPVAWLRPLKRLVGVLPVSGKLAWLAAPLLYGRFSTAALRKSLQHALERVSRRTMHARMRAALEVDYSEKLGEIRVPILYLQASEDLVVTASSTRHVLKIGRSVELVTLKAPHLLLQVLPLEAAAAIEKFIHQCYGFSPEDNRHA